MALLAFVDESMRRRSGDAYVYALAAVLLEEHVCADLRERLPGLRAGRSQRVHWRDESDEPLLWLADVLVGSVV